MLVDGLEHKSLQVKQNCSETLAFLLKDPNVRALINDEKIINSLVPAYRANIDQLFFENVLLCLMHLSYEKKFKPPIYEQNLVETLLYHIVNSKSNEEAIYAT